MHVCHRDLINQIYLSFELTVRFATDKNIAGSTDSEHFAALFMTYLCKGGQGKAAWNNSYTGSQMKVAMVEASKTVFQMQRKKLGSKAPANSLNGKSQRFLLE